MNKRIPLLILVPALCLGSVAIGQEMLLDMAANKVITRYQNASCEQLAMQRAAPKTPEQQRAVQFLHNDPTARAAFINKIAAPIANKLFECGLIP
jgi:hypothetical protein